MKHKIVASLDELDPYRKEWESLRLDCRSSIFTSFDLVRIWLEAFKSTAQPQMVMVEDGGALVGVAPMCMQKQSMAGLPVRNLNMVGFGKEILGYSLMSVMAKDADDATLNELVRGIGKVKWNLMQLIALDPTPSTLRFLELCKAGFSWQPYTEVSNIFYEFPPEGDITAKFGWRSRKILRKARRDLEREGRMQLRIARTVEEAEESMHLYVRQHDERWSQKGGSIFRDERNTRQLLEVGKYAVRSGTGIIHEMLIDGEVAAQSLVMFDGDVGRGYRIGMIDKFEEFSPGKLMFVLMMEDLRARGFRGYDFLRGDEDYKYHMMTHERTLPAIQVLRGSLLTMSKVRNFAPVRMVDERLKVRDRMLKKMS
ncbi:MAG: GNAT family N-acetyltransferase [Methanomassiliicoccales archaeon]|nr:GNAT family N-acetyltransferase [Methanomassiliicoccales archaeon]